MEAQPNKQIDYWDLRAQDFEALSPREMEIVRGSGLFSGLPEKILEGLLNKTSIVKYTRGTVLFLQGQPAENCYLLLDGWVKIFRNTPGSKQVVLAVRSSGETIAESAVIKGWNYTSSAEVASDARLLRIPAGPLLKLLRENGGFSMLMLGYLSEKLHGMAFKLGRFQTQSAPQRLGNFLLSLTGSEDKKAAVEIPYDKSLLAASLGMKPESLSRAQLKLKLYGVETKGKKVTLSNITKLREYCLEHDPSQRTPF